MFLLVLVLALPHTLSSLSSPLTLRPLSLAALARSHLPLWVHTQPCTGSSPAHPRDTHSHAGMLRAPTTSTGTDRQTDSKAHPPPLIRLRSESTSSAPSMATSSCGKRRKLVWKPLLCSIQALLPMQLQGWRVPSSSHKCHQSWEHLGASLSRASDGPPKDTLRPPQSL